VHLKTDRELPVSSRIENMHGFEQVLHQSTSHLSNSTLHKADILRLGLKFCSCRKWWP